MKTYSWPVKSTVKCTLTVDKSQYGPNPSDKVWAKSKQRQSISILVLGRLSLLTNHNFVSSQSLSFLMYLCIPSLHTLPLGKLHGVEFADVWMESHDLEPAQYFLSSAYHLIVFHHSLIFLIDSFSTTQGGEGWTFIPLILHLLWPISSQMRDISRSVHNN